VPLGVVVAQVSALQQAATRLDNVKESCKLQLNQLEDRAKLELSEFRRELMLDARKILSDRMEHASESSKGLLSRFGEMRDRAIERFVPLLMMTVQKFNGAFESSLTKQDEEALERLTTLCTSIRTKGRSLRQDLPTSKQATELSTLMYLLSLAIESQTRIQLLCEDAIRGIKGAVIIPGGIKKILRCLQKSQEEYGGEYTRLLDLSRISIIFQNIVDLERSMRWMMDERRKPRFEVLRIKDRLSRGFDAEMSGGNRDIMLNGLLEMGAGRKLIVEIQLHVEVLYALKGDLHVLYAGARVLGAMEDAIAKHEGVLTSEVLQRSKRGVVRKVHCAFTKSTENQRQQLIDVIQLEPCPLLELDLAYSKCNDAPMFDNVSVVTIFLGTNSEKLLQSMNKQTLACRHLRFLNLASTGLEGVIPREFGKMVSLCVLDLEENDLVGIIPQELGDCKQLNTLILADNNLSGLIPHQALLQLNNLVILKLGNNKDMLTTVPAKNALAELLEINIKAGKKSTFGYQIEDYNKDRDMNPEAFWPTILGSRDEQIILPGMNDLRKLEKDLNDAMKAKDTTKILHFLELIEEKKKENALEMKNRIASNNCVSTNEFKE
jgi:hypothetical protein